MREFWRFMRRRVMELCDGWWPSLDRVPKALQLYLLLQKFDWVVYP